MLARFRLLPIFVVLLLTAYSNLELFAQQNWPGFHGPSADCWSESDSAAIEWSESENIVWKTAIHDFGWSSPVVWNDQIWMTTADLEGRSMSAVCVDRTSGEIVHDVDLFSDQEPTDTLLINSYASPTPCIEEGRVYVHFGTYGTACLDTVTADVVWQRVDLNCDHLRGPGSSPVLDGELLYLTYDGADYQFVVALDKRTGETVWKTDRTTEFGEMDGDLRKAYCTPLMIEVEGERQLICVGAHAAYAYTPDTGEELWHILFSGYSNASRPLFDGERIYINTGFGRSQLWAVTPTGRGDVTDTHVLWKATRGILLKPTPVLVDGLIYMPCDDGILKVIDPETGEIVFEERLKGKYSASPVVVDGLIYMPNETGETFVVRPGEEPEILADNSLDEGCMASPAVVDGELYLRTRTHLYRIECP